MSFQALRAERQSRQRDFRVGGADAPASTVSENENVTTSASIASSSTSAGPSSSPAPPIAQAGKVSVVTTSTKANVTSVTVTTRPASAADVALYPDLMDTALEVRVADDSGRGLYAKRAIAAGTTLFMIPPRTAVLSSAKLHTHCSSCFQEPVAPKKVSRCAACKAAHYCSAACQKVDWPSHKPECAAHKRFRSMWAAAYPQKAKDGNDRSWVLNEAVRALGRMCWARRAERMGATDPFWWKQVAAMVTAPKQDAQHTMRLMAQVQHLLHYLGAADAPKAGQDPNFMHPAELKEYGFTSARELLDMCSAFMTNSFTLTTPDLSPTGVATSPICALFNHSCAPNAVIVFPKAGTGMNVVAIADIKPGEQVLTSYLDVAQPYPERQLEVRDRYGFVCKCTLCAMPASWVDPRWSVRHVGCKQDGMGHVPDLGAGDSKSRCNACGEDFDVDDALGGLVAEGKRLIADDDAGITLDRETGLQQLERLVPALSALMPDSSHPLLWLLRSHALQLLPPRTHAEQTTAAALLARCISAAAGVYPAHHPSVALWKAERARLLALCLDSTPGAERMREQAAAVDALRDAVTSCDMAFGAGGDVAAGLRSELTVAEGYLAMWSDMSRQ